MKKIDFTALVKKPENDCETTRNGQSSLKSSPLDYKFQPDFGQVDQDKLLNINEMVYMATLDYKRRDIPGIDNKNSPAPEGVSTEKTRAVNLHPIAVCLLLSVAKKIRSSNEEIFSELLKLETMPPIEQVKTWARYALENGIDPHQIIYPFIKSPGKGNDCMTCSNLDMTSTKQPDASRKLYQWRCKKNHQILEAYYLRERVLVSPVECSDYDRQGAG